MSTDGFKFSEDGKTLLKCDFPQLGTSVEVPYGCTRIANGVFAEAPVISVSLPDSVTELGENVFSSCETLQRVKLPKNLTSIKPFTFAGCSALSKIEMPDNLPVFPEGLFWGCSSLKEIPFRTGIESFEVDVFRDCEGLTSLQIPQTVKTIKNGSLANCTNLSTIVFPSALESIQDRSLAGCTSLSQMRFDGECEKFYVDEDYGCLYERTEDGSILIKCPVNLEKVYLAFDTCDVHIDAFEGCTSLGEVYASEEAPESLVNKLLELVPEIDVNSYSSSMSEEEQFVEDISHLSENLDSVKVNASEFTPLDENSTQEEQNDNTQSKDKTESLLDDILNQNNSSDDESESSDDGVAINPNELAGVLANSSLAEKTEEKKSQTEIDVDAILNDQCIRNDALDEGFRPVTMDELERLMGGPAEPVVEQNSAPDENPEIQASSEKEDSVEEKPETESAPDESAEKNSLDQEEKPKKKRTYKKRAKKTDDESSSEEKPKKRRTRKSKEASEEFTYTDADEKEVSALKKANEEKQAPQEEPDDELQKEVREVSQEEPRFIRAMKNLASHQMVLEESQNEKEDVYGDLKELLVIADGVAPSTNDFSSHLVKFSKDVAKKYGFTKIYFFENLPLDNPEFIFGLENFGKFRNILYACNKPCPDKISENQKELISAASIKLPDQKLISVKDPLKDSNLNYPVKILVQDNYIEGLLYCAEKYRETHGIK